MKLTNKDMSVLIGLLLGDGYIDDKGRIGIEHCEKQKDYCIYKAKLLHTVCGGKDIKVHEYIRNRSILKDGKQFKENTFTTYSFKKQSKNFIPIREMLYDKETRKKHITKEILQYLTPEAIALWWLDDGSLTEKYTYPKGEKVKCGYNLRLYTYLTEEENILIQKYFIDNYNMTWNVVPAENGDKSKFILRCGSIEGRKFLNIIRNYVLERIPSMSYKVINI